MISTASPELLLVKKQKANLLRKKIALIKQFGLAYYKPFDKQAAFHAAGARGVKRRMVQSGNRWGKSTAGVAEDCAWVMNHRAWLPESDSACRGGIPQHPVKLLTIAQDWDKVDEIFTSQRGEGGKVWRFLPKDFVKATRRNHSGAIDTIECSNGSLWRFDTVKSFMANPAGSESSDWDAIHVDEPIPIGMWKAVSRGLMDRSGSAWFLLTQLTEFWINDFFFPEDTGGQPRSDVWALRGDTHDNPYLSTESINQFISELTQEEVQCRIKGIPLHLSGLIYKDFSWDVHVCKSVPSGWTSYTEPPVGWGVYVFIDPHPQTPHAVLFATVSPQGYRYYFDDLFDHCSIEDLAKQILSRLKGRTPVWAKMDPLGFVNDPITETNMALELADHGVFVEKATKALAEGILRVQGELKKRSAHGGGVVQFTPSCKRTLWEIQRYCWNQKEGYENTPIDKDDHMMENLYRAEISGMRYVDTTAKRVGAIGMEEFTRPLLDLHDLTYTGETKELEVV